MKEERTAFEVGSGAAVAQSVSLQGLGLRTGGKLVQIWHRPVSTECGLVAGEVHESDLCVAYPSKFSSAASSLCHYDAPSYKGLITVRTAFVPFFKQSLLQENRL